MRNCWTYSTRELLDAGDDEQMHVAFRYTSKNRWSWRAPRWLHTVVGWAVIMPCLVIINFAFFALRGRWLHSYWEADGALMEYTPEPKGYMTRRLPSLSFVGVVRDSGKRLVRGYRSDLPEE